MMREVLNQFNFFFFKKENTWKGCQLKTKIGNEAGKVNGVVLSWDLSVCAEECKILPSDNVLA